MESGLVDADLGGFPYKKRVAGSGKSGGSRTLLSARIGSRYLFLHGFPKSDKANITGREEGAASCRQGVPGTVRRGFVEGVAVGRVIGGAL